MTPELTICAGDLVITAEQDSYGAYLVIECESCSWSMPRPGSVSVKGASDLQMLGHQRVS